MQTEGTKTFSALLRPRALFSVCRELWGVRVVPPSGLRSEGAPQPRVDERPQGRSGSRERRGAAWSSNGRPRAPCTAGGRGEERGGGRGWLGLAMGRGGGTRGQAEVQRRRNAESGSLLAWERLSGKEEEGTGHQPPPPQCRACPPPP